MIYSRFGLKFIFVHIPKCGGTSIEENIGFNFEKNIGFDFEKQNNIKGKHTKYFRLSDYEHLLGDSISEFFTFSLIRNPWERMVSNYNSDIISSNVTIDGKNTIEEKKDISFEEYLNLVLNKKIDNYVVNYKSWYNGNKYKSDYICKLENIQSDFSYVCGRLGIDNRQLEHVNKTDYTYNKDYRSYYNNETKDLIYKSFKYEIMKFKYDF